MHVPGAYKKTEESIGSSGSRFTDGYAPSCRCWENLGPVEKQPVLLPSELSLQSNHCDLYVSLSSLQLYILGQTCLNNVSILYSLLHLYIQDYLWIFYVGVHSFLIFHLFVCFIHVYAC